MKVGGKRKIWVPSKLAYGPQGKPPSIPPNSNLEFDIELMGIK
jgi:FKBP-type peptidyl-prolyl cis-trans isomerase FkpA